MSPEKFTFPLTIFLFILLHRWRDYAKLLYFFAVFEERTSIFFLNDQTYNVFIMCYNCIFKIMINFLYWIVTNVTNCH